MGSSSPKFGVKTFELPPPSNQFPLLKIHYLQRPASWMKGIRCGFSKPTVSCRNMCPSNSKQGGWRDPYQPMVYHPTSNINQVMPSREPRVISHFPHISSNYKAFLHVLWFTAKIFTIFVLERSEKKPSDISWSKGWHEFFKNLPSLTTADESFAQKTTADGRNTADHLRYIKLLK